MTSPRIQEIVTQLGTAIGDNSGLGGTLRFDFGTDGPVLIDGVHAQHSRSDGERKSAGPIARSVWTLETYDKMVKGELDGTSAFMQGKLRVAGRRHGPRDEARPDPAKGAGLESE